MGESDDAVPPPDDGPQGGGEVAANELQADNEVEQDQLEALDPMGDPA